MKLVALRANKMTEQNSLTNEQNYEARVWRADDGNLVLEIQIEHVRPGSRKYLCYKEDHPTAQKIMSLTGPIDSVDEIKYLSGNELETIFSTK